MSELGDDVVDVRDLIERYGELEAQEERDEAEVEEFATLGSALDELKGYSGDHQWKGDWYPVALVRDSYFEEYARELADDLGLIKNDAEWPYTYIDWEQAARELLMDYSSVDIDGVTYWYR